MRAWLAWVVVASHIAQFAGLPSYRLGQLAHYAVLGFVLISGFVIAHLVIERREAYGPYLIRRVMRLFPAYLVCLPIGALTIPWAIDALSGAAWADASQIQRLVDLDSALRARPLEQAGLHLGLLQGLVPDSTWLRTSTTMLPPAWSLSLEWQFYLLAPVLVAALSRPALAHWVMALALVLAVAFHFGMFGTFIQPAFLPGALYLFCVGILVRVHIAKITPALRFMRPLLAALEHRVFAYFGERSYAVYVAHYPIIQIAVFVLVPFFADNHAVAAVAIASASILLTLLISDLLYRLVEKPMIRKGAQLAAAMPRQRQRMVTGS